MSYYTPPGAAPSLPSVFAIADAVAHRFDSPNGVLEKIFPAEVMSQIKPVWNVDEEGEQRNVWRDSGVPNFWFMMGNLMWCRFHSKHVALRESPVSALLGLRSDGIWSGFFGRDNVLILSVYAPQRSKRSKKAFSAGAAAKTATSKPVPFISGGKSIIERSIGIFGSAKGKRYVSVTIGVRICAV